MEPNGMEQTIIDWNVWNGWNDWNDWHEIDQEIIIVHDIIMHIHDFAHSRWKRIARELDHQSTINLISTINHRWWCGHYPRVHQYHL